MDVDSIPSLSVMLATQDSLSKVSTAVLKQSMDTAEVASAGLLKMIDAAAMERSVNPSVGSNFDMVV